MIDGIVVLFLALLDFVINLLFTPINYIIENHVPGLNDIFVGISNLVNYLISSISYVVSWLPLSSQAIALIITYYTFKLTVPLLVHSIKIFINWISVLRG